MIKEIKDSIEKAESQYDNAKKLNKEADSEYKKADLNIKSLRATYKNTIKDYDFLEDMQEIENFNLFEG